MLGELLGLCLLAITSRKILAKFVSRPSPSLFVPSGSIEHHNRGANLLQNLYRVTFFLGNERDGNDFGHGLMEKLGTFLPKQNFNKF